MLEDSPEYLFWMAGAVQRGASVIGLNELQAGLSDDAPIALCRLIVSDGPGLDTLSALGFDTDRTIDLNAATFLTLVHSDDEQIASSRARSEDRAHFSFFEGPSSTIEVTLEHATRAAHQVMRATEMTRYDICYDPLALGHENSLVACWASAVMAGSEIVLQQEYAAEKFLGDVQEYNCTFFSFAGSMISDLLDLPLTDKDGEHRLRVGFGTDSTPSERLEFAQRYGCPLIDASQWHMSLMFGG